MLLFFVLLYNDYYSEQRFVFINQSLVKVSNSLKTMKRLKKFLGFKNILSNKDNRKLDIVLQMN